MAQPGLIYPITVCVELIVLQTGACIGSQAAEPAAGEQIQPGTLNTCKMLLTHICPNKKIRSHWKPCGGSCSSVRQGKASAALHGCFYKVPETVPSSWAGGVWVYTWCILHLETSGVELMCWIRARVKPPVVDAGSLVALVMGGQAQWKSPSSLRRNTPAPLLMGGQAQWAGGPPSCWQLRSSVWLDSRRLK